MEHEQRKRALTDEDVAAIRSSLYDTISQEEHEMHHNLFRDWLDKEKAKDVKVEKMKGQFFGGLILAATGSVGSLLYWIGTYVKEHWK